MPIPQRIDGSADSHTGSPGRLEVSNGSMITARLRVPIRSLASKLPQPTQRPPATDPDPQLRTALRRYYS
jgi:hypothetical protein